MSVQRIQVLVGGHTLSLLASGPPDGETIVLLHGIPAGAELWREVLPPLGAAGYRALAPDLPGYGETAVPDGADLSLGGIAETLALWLHESGLPPVWLVGHDLGGGVAQILAARNPRLLSRLTLGDTVCEDSWPVLPIRLFRPLARLGLYPALAATRLVPNPYASWELRRGFHDPAKIDRGTAARVFWDAKVQSRRGRRAFARHLAALDCRQTVVVTPKLAGLDMPTQLVWAENDRFQSWEEIGVRLRDRLPDPAVSLIPEAGHFVPVERPQAYAAALLGFVA